MPLLDDPTVNARTWLDSQARLAALIVRGNRLPTDVVEAVTEATLSMSTTEVTQLELTVSDPRMELLAADLFSPGGTNRAGSRMDYGSVLMECAAVELVDGDSLALKVTARSMGSQRMRRARGYLIRKKISPTEFVAIAAKEAGLRFVGQPTSDRRSIARAKDETSWDVCQRLAEELGFICFEVAATLYFGKPTWLAERSDHELRIGWDAEDTDPRIVGAPACRRTGDDPKKVATVSVNVLGELGDDVLVGHKLVLDGIPTFEGAYLIDTVSIPLAGDQPVAIGASTAVNPTPQPPSPPGRGKSSSSGGSTVTYSGQVSIPATGRLTVKGVRASREQLANATTIYKVGRAMGIDAYGIQIALAAAIQESVLRNLSYGDRDSIGLFQQRNSWGSYATRHDPAGAARLFFNALKRVPGWHSKSVAAAAQAVQRSAFPSAYARWAGEAKALVNAIAATRKTVVKSSGGKKTPGGGPRATGGHSAGAFVAVALKQAGKRYVFGAETSPSDPNPRAFDCSELVQWACARVGVNFVDGSSNQRAHCRSISVSQAIRTRGALLFHPGHVAISLGNGRTIEAANSRVGVVSYSAYNRFTSGGLIPGIAY